MRGQTPGELPNALYRGKLWAVGRQKEKQKISGVSAQEWFQEPGVMVSGIVEDQNHALSGLFLAQKGKRPALSP